MTQCCLTSVIFCRVRKKNPLCNLSGVQWARPNIFKKPTRGEIQNGLARRANLMDINDTGLPALTMPLTSCISLSPYSQRLTHGYVTNFQERTLVQQFPELGNWVNLADWHQRAAQVMLVTVQWCQYLDNIKMSTTPCILRWSPI